MNDIEDQDSKTESLLAGEREISGSNPMSRRKAVAILAKCTAYTAPAVLALLATKRVNAKIS